MIGSYLLRHNDIHYARACQAFSIELEKQMIRKSIDFSLWFWTKRRQTTRLTGEKWAATFIHAIQCHLALQKNNNSLEREKRRRKSNDTKSRFIYSQNGIVVKSGSSVHHHHHNIVMPHKSETKWIYWPLFSPDIDMISLKLWKLKYAFDVCSRESIIN